MTFGWWLALVGCSSTDEALLESMAGSWEGSVTVGESSLGMQASFRYEGVLQGTLSVQETGGEATYGIRAADAFNQVVDVALQQENGIQFLTLGGNREGTTYSGDATMTFDCGKPQPCGYSGPFVLDLVDAGPTGDEGPPDDTGA